VSPI
jgi:hypothetical protein